MMKAAFHALAAIAISPLTIVHALLYPIFGDDLFAACSQTLSLLPGKTGSYLRVGFYRFAMEKCARDCYIGFGTLFFQRATIIGPGVYIGPQCNIGACRIGRDTLVASGVHIMSGREQHHFATLTTPIREQGGVYEQIRLGEDCWIGNGSLVMAEVGRQCVIGAGSVVNRRIEDFAVAVGNPARVLRRRENGTRSGSETATGAARRTSSTAT